MLNGYPTFVIAIACIGVCTAVIGDVAGHLGCFIYLKDSVNAIAFVALGTSVPGTKESSVNHMGNYSPDFCEKTCDLRKKNPVKNCPKRRTLIMNSLISIISFSHFIPFPHLHSITAFSLVPFSRFHSLVFISYIFPFSPTMHHHILSARAPSPMSCANIN